MNNLISAFLVDETGATAIEYGLIAAGIAVAIITVVHARAVAQGEAELAISLTSSLLLVWGGDVIGKIPSELQNYLVFTAAVEAAATQPEAAKAFVKHLTAPEAVSVIKAKGWEPVTR